MAPPKTEVSRASLPVLGKLLRKRRGQLGLTLQGLGDAAGLSVGYLSHVERDKAVPSLATLAQIAQALEVGLDYFVSTPKPADAFSRAAARAQFAIAGSSIVYEAISTDYPGSELSSYILHVPPGYASEVVAHDGEEIIVILAGQIEQTLDGQVFAMTEGDSMHYNGATPHAWANKTTQPARVLWTGMLGVLHQRGAVPRLPPAAANDNT